LAPLAANAQAMPKPIPLVDPVTSAHFPLSDCDVLNGMGLAFVVI
jgi:hypothetical protein